MTSKFLCLMSGVGRLRSVAAAVCLAMSAAPASALAETWDGRILEARSGEDRSFTELLQAVSYAPIVVLGEKHNTAAVQIAQARVLEGLVRLRGLEGRFTLGWEFLSFSRQELTSRAFERYRRGELDGEAFLKEAQGSVSNATYLPILEQVRDLGGALLGVNLSWAEKAPVVAGGIAAADPALVPPGFTLGGPHYWARFAETMQGHASPEQMARYFDAQCLTDDVMAYRLAENAGGHVPDQPLRFLVVGGFHTDYRDGAVRRLELRAPGQGVAVIRFIDASDHFAHELRALLRDPRYGELADFVYFIGEPQADPVAR